MQTFDGGDHYLPFPATLPEWVPMSWSVAIRTFLGFWVTVIIGRYIGGLLGYQPFYREYTTDWELAVAKMQGTWFYRRNVQTAYRAATSWKELREMVPYSDEGAANMGLADAKVGNGAAVKKAINDRAANNGEDKKNL